MSSIIKVDTIQKADGNTATVQDLGLATGALSHRNLIINGAMQVAQRGTTASVTSSATQNVYLTVDRFNLFRDGTSTSTFDISQEDDAPPESGCHKSLKIQTTATDTAGANGCRWYQRIEQQDCKKLSWGTSSAKDVTLSFWVKSSTTGQGGVTLLTQQGGSLSYLYAKLYTITTADTWQKITMTFEGNTAGSEFTDATTEGIRIEWWMDSGSTHDDGTAPSDEWITYTGAKRGRDITLDLMGTVGNNFYLTGCQLELGSVATPFEHRSYGEELARCERYYQIAVEGSSKVFAMGTIWNNNAHYGVLYFRPMRTTPTFTDTTGSGYYRFRTNGSSYNSSEIGFADITAYSCMIYGDGSGGTNGNGGWWDTNNSSAKISLDAEL